MSKQIRINYFYLIFIAFILIFEVINNLPNILVIITIGYLVICLILVNYIPDELEYLYYLSFAILLVSISYLSNGKLLYLQIIGLLFLAFDTPLLPIKLIVSSLILLFDIKYLKINVFSEFSILYFSVAIFAVIINRIINNLKTKINELSITDDLTGLLNQKGFLKRIEDEYYRSVRYQKNFTLIMLDSDDLKSVNDTYGHKYGTKVILFIADEIKKNIRRTDFACRYGGDEFLICLVETPISKGKVLAERLKDSIAIKPIFTEKGKSFNVTVSLGVVSFPDTSTKLNELLDLVDKAMYKAKKEGKNSVYSLLKN